jgi:hypothetical protein
MLQRPILAKMIIGHPCSNMKYRVVVIALAQIIIQLFKPVVVIDVKRRKNWSVCLGIRIGTDQSITDILKGRK